MITLSNYPSGCTDGAVHHLTSHPCTLLANPVAVKQSSVEQSSLFLGEGEASPSYNVPTVPSSDQALCSGHRVEKMLRVQYTNIELY